ncbi:MAG: peptidoglycan-binding domain-containing protein [Sedimentibacter sp.]
MINNINNINNILSSMKQSEVVSEIQHYLRNISYSQPELQQIIITGIYDTPTREAVSAFQNIVGLPVTGKVDFNTWKALINANNLHVESKEMPHKIPCCSYDFVEIKNGYEGDIVYAIKIMLNNFSRKFSNYNKLEITNKYNNETEEEIKKFQKTSMLPVTGIVDKTTWNTLVSIFDTCKFYK